MITMTKTLYDTEVERKGKTPDISQGFLCRLDT